MTESELKAIKDVVNAMGEHTRACIVVNISHAGVANWHFQGPFESAIFLAWYFDGELRKHFQKMSLAAEQNPVKAQ